MARRNGGFIGTDGLDAPDPPTGISAEAGDAAISISFTAPTDVGTSAITGFVATTDDGNGGTGTSSPITISSLTNGTAYTARVYAINAYGTSAASDASASASPQAAVAFFISGQAASGYRTEQIERTNISSSGGLIDFGDIAIYNHGHGACSSTTRALSGGGTGFIDVIEYITMASAGNAQDFGDLTAGRAGGVASASSKTRGLFAGGWITNASTYSNIIDYVTIASTGNAQDFGDLTAVRNSLGAGQSPTRAVFGGGYGGSDSNTIDYVTIASTGNASNFGALTSARRSTAGCSNSTRAVFFGGENSSNTYIDIIDYVTIASTGNATDFGDLSVACQKTSGTASETYAVISRGQHQTSNSTNDRGLDRITIASTGNASTFGTLAIRRQYGFRASTGNSHGGLQ